MNNMIKNYEAAKAIQWPAGGRRIMDKVSAFGHEGRGFKSWPVNASTSGGRNPIPEINVQRNSMNEVKY